MPELPHQLGEIVRSIDRHKAENSVFATSKLAVLGPIFFFGKLIVQ